MLPAGHRLTKGADFALTMRGGSRAGRARLVTHVALGRPGPALVGFVVSKAVGNAVVRNRVQRRLRHLVRARLELLPPGTRLVVRALPAAATATSSELDVDLASALRAALTKAGASGPETEGSR